jgi:hypothetical protein
MLFSRYGLILHGSFGEILSRGSILSTDTVERPYEIHQHACDLTCDPNEFDRVDAYIRNASLLPVFDVRVFFHFVQELGLGASMPVGCPGFPLIGVVRSSRYVSLRRARGGLSRSPRRSGIWLTGATPKPM